MSIEDLCCSICLDDIDISMNLIRTECKHCFHSNCFLQNAAHNGFNCPMCRNELAEIPQDDDSDDDSEEEEEEEDEEDFSLRGSRWLFMRAEGEQIDEDDTDDESIDEDDFEYIRYEEDEEVPNKSIAEIAEKINELGITYKQLVALLILPDSRNQADLNEFSAKFLSETDTKLRNIIMNIANA
jgi:hypothetical protein